MQVGTFAFASLGVKGVAPWNALDSVWILDFYVTIKQRGRERGTEEEKQGRRVGTNKQEREADRQEEEGRVMGNINKASKKNSKRKKVRIN